MYVAYHIMPNRFIISRLITYWSAEYYSFSIELSIISNHPPYLYQKIKFSRSNKGKKMYFIKYSKAASEQQFFNNSIHLWGQYPMQAILKLSYLNTFRGYVFLFFVLLCYICLKCYLFLKTKFCIIYYNFSFLNLLWS